ncbi:conserved protein of unknown function BmrU [Thioflavicoccus mobilis 8321]|uniref:DAGKc domain-containing protein n=1 Tax=Thioflavicoccus mobilis 8321 TaxID=765912 RepID=L0GYG4_9GAMM|nr:YegS/Rv2252/BmrU family lipid kinase [Thioflavicoccus mobilis]AGA90867.1 conserved protein of unknown function BmrU [Thioflavicoccus mobilis 8321]
MPHRIAFIVNPRAGAGNPPIEPLARLLANEGAAVTTYRTDALRTTADIDQALGRADAAVIGGGDGTVNSMIASILRHAVPLGIIPLGTANDLARTLDIPSDPLEAGRVVLAGRTRRIDVGQANGLHFMNAAGVGLSVAIGERLSQAEKARLGVLAYARHLWRLLGRGEGLRAEIDGDGLRLRGRVVQVTVANGRHYGGGMTVHDGAQIDDATLTVLVVRPQSLLTYARHILAFRSGRFRPDAPVALGRTTRLALRTRPAQSVALDGEIRTTTPVELRVLPQALTVHVP